MENSLPVSGVWKLINEKSGIDADFDGKISITEALKSTPKQLSDILIDAIDAGVMPSQVAKFIKAVDRQNSALAQDAMRDYAKYAGGVSQKRLPLLDQLKGSDLYVKPKIVEEDPKGSHKELPGTKDKLKQDTEMVIDEIMSKRASINNWWEQPKYNPDFFKVNPGTYHRENAKYDISSLQMVAIPKSDAFGIKNYFRIPRRLPEDFVPLGRLNDALKTDEIFFKNTKSILDAKYKNTSNTFFINYTGHQGPVGAALSELNTPVFWQIFGDERIINSLQDWKESYMSNNFKNDTNACLLLEPNHGIPQINYDDLPPINTLKEKGINSFVVFTENRYGGSYTTDDLPNIDPPIIKYLQEAKAAGIDIHVEGVDFRD